MTHQTDHRTKHQDGITTTLNAVRSCSPCSDGWKKLLSYLGKTTSDDEPLPLLTILDSNGVDDCLWCLRAIDGVDSFSCHIAIDFAERCQTLMTDERSIAALDVARRHANGQASDSELVAAWAAAAADADAAAAAWDAERNWQTAHLREALLDPAKYLASKFEVTA